MPQLHGWGRVLRMALTWLPRNAISRFAGRVASLQLPGPLQRAEIRLFARLAGVDLGEAAEPIEAYSTLNGFFARRLREGARPISSEASVLVSPCDGAWGEAGRVENGTILQIKGLPYRVEDLLGDAALARRYEGGAFATFYLSPRDYHRFHTPTSGTIRRLDYWPGSLWPVNEIGLRGVDGLFARNERICAYLETDGSESRTLEPGSSDEAAPGETAPGDGAALALVAVGATMVGSVRLSFDDLRTNVRSAGPQRRDLGDAAPHFARGQEWGHFEFGSTIVMLVPPGRFDLSPRPVGTPLRLGEPIGRRHG